MGAGDRVLTALRSAPFGTSWAGKIAGEILAAAANRGGRGSRGQARISVSGIVCGPRKPIDGPSCRWPKGSVEPVCRQAPCGSVTDLSTDAAGVPPGGLNYE